MIASVVELHHVSHFGDIKQPGDYLFVEDGRVVMACPACSQVFVCPHTVIQQEPLTLSPSVVGPDTPRDARQQVQGPCLHHFWVKEGMAIDVSGLAAETADPQKETK